MNDILSSEVIDRLLPFVDYDSDMIAHSSTRETDDFKVNNFVEKLLNLCKSTGLIILNGWKSGEEQGKITFYNSRGMSTIDRRIVCKHCLLHVHSFVVDSFHEYLDHAPFILSLRSLVKNTGSKFGPY